MPQGALYWNGTDLSTLGFTVERLPNWPTLHERQLLTDAALGRVGSVVSSPYPTMADQQLIAQGFFKNISQAAIQSTVDAIQAVLWHSQFAEIRSWLDNTRVLFARPANITLDIADPQGLNTFIHATIYVRLHSPFCYDRYPKEYVIESGRRREIPLGTAPSSPQWVTLGGLTSITTQTITVRGANGLTIATWTLSGPTIDETTYFGIDTDLGTNFQVVSGVSTDGRLSQTTQGFPILNPADGDRASGRYPTVAVTNGSIKLRVRRAWLR